MSGATGIAWTDATWNPVRGCSRVSEGCRNCYAEGIAARFNRYIDEIPGPRVGQTSEPFYGFAVRTPAGPRWTGKVALIPEKLSEPLHWRKPRRVFVNSMSDLFHEKLMFEEIAAVFGVMAVTPHLTYQILTKRPERMREWFEAIRERGLGYAGLGEANECHRRAWQAGNDEVAVATSRPASVPWPLPNVWLGVSAEDQETLRHRAWALLKTPAAVRFLSLEPLLGPVDLNEPELLCDAWRRGGTIGTYLDWVIVGGESGPKARPCDVAWIRRVVEQCRETKTACFVKQMGANVRDRNDAGFEADLETYADGPKRGRPTEPRAWPSPLDVEHDPVDTNYQGAPVRVRLRDRAGADPSEWPEDLRVREFPEVYRG